MYIQLEEELAELDCGFTGLTDSQRDLLFWLRLRLHLLATVALLRQIFALENLVRPQTIANTGNRGSSDEIPSISFVDVNSLRTRLRENAARLAHSLLLYSSTSFVYESFRKFDSIDIRFQFLLHGFRMTFSLKCISGYYQ